MNTGGHAPDSEVHLLKKQVDRHLSVPHIFQCISDHVIEGIHTVKPINDLPGWWGKLNLFSIRNSHSRNLWLDLDVTITRNIDTLVEPLKHSQLRVARNWAQSGHGGCQSSVMYWEGTSAQIIPESFDHTDAHWPPRNNAYWDNGQVKWGDQEWVTYLRDTGQIQVSYFDPAHVVSYKYHCRNGLPPDSLVQVFHGKPDPADVDEEWIKQCRR
jgi:hypothetical protein